MSLLIILFTFSIFTLSRADYTWPDPTLDEIEHITHVQKGLFGSGILDQIPSCKTGIPQGDDSEQSPADWLRTAFHDVASYDAASGTGGLDASLQWETNRTENRGAHAFINTLQFMSKYHSIRTSMSDLIALAAYSAVGNCGGPLLTMKARRVDATGPAPEGRLPAPSDPTSTLIRKFANAGFNQREMIQMVACGHTLGGVHKESFPEIVGSTSFSDFDRTENKFDHRVASEYLDGTTKNPLVRALGGNNSDFKVFNSDGNSTIRAMSTPSAFAASCRVILQRMIDTVPASVTLSPPLAPQTVKPHRLQLELTNTGTLQLKGYIRIKIDGKGISGVKLIYQDRDGKPISDPIKTRLVTTQGGIGKGLEASFKFFEISPNTLTNGISGFVVSVTKSTGTKVIYDNNGHGYPVQDAIIVQQPQSCLSSSNANGIADLTVTAAIRKDIISQEPQMNIVIKSEMPDTLVPRLSVESVQMRAWKNETAGYVLYRGSYSLPASSRSTTFDVWTKDAQGTRYEDTFKPTSELSETCGEWQAMHRSHRRSLFNTGIERWSTRRIDHTKHARAHQHGLEYDSTRETPVNVDRTIPVRGHLSP